MMDGSEFRTGIPGQESEGFQDTVLTSPILPDTRHHQRRSSLQLNKIGLLATFLALPFKPTIGGYEASPLPEGLTKGRFLIHGFRPGID